MIAALYIIIQSIPQLDCSVHLCWKLLFPCCFLAVPLILFIRQNDFKTLPKVVICAIAAILVACFMFSSVYE
jgi:hypothetical protein